MSFQRFVAGLLLFAVPVIAGATSYDTSHLPYSDAPRDRATAVAVSVLTNEGVIQGHPDGTFREFDSLNRAEYMTIIMRLAAEIEIAFALGCFPDIPSGVWYEAAVCKAKYLGFVRGNQKLGVPQEDWPFEPDRDVQYEEAVKVLVELYNLNVPDMGGEWYDPYLAATESAGVDLPGMRPGQKLTRGQMARLTVAFFAYSNGELALLRAAEEGREPPQEEEVSPPPPPPPPPTTQPPPVFPLPPPVTYDPSQDTSLSPNFLLLGATSGVLGAANIFSETEPIIITDFVITLANAVSSIDALKVFTEDGVFLGNAHATTGATYRLNVKTKGIRVPQAKDFSFYIRAITKNENAGGVSGEDVQVDSMGIEGQGEWSTRTYSKSTTETFNTHETARSVITSIRNATVHSDVLIAGSDQVLAKFTFDGREGDDDASLAVTQLLFQIEQTGGVTLSSVSLSTSDTNDESSCSVAGSTVTCTSIPSSIGSFEDGPVTIEVTGDISIPSGVQSASLRLTINDPGDIATNGSVRWTDGTTTFGWVPFPRPVAQGTYFEQ